MSEKVDLHKLSLRQRISELSVVCNRINKAFSEKNEASEEQKAMMCCLEQMSDILRDFNFEFEHDYRHLGIDREPHHGQSIFIAQNFPEKYKVELTKEFKKNNYYQAD